MRGALSGVIWGTLVSGVVLGVSSVTTMPPGVTGPAVTPETGATETRAPEPQATPEREDAVVTVELPTETPTPAEAADETQVETPAEDPVTDPAPETQTAETGAPVATAPSAPPPPSDAPELASDAPGMAAPRDGADRAPAADTASADQPVVESAETVMAAPDAGETGGIAVQTEAPVLAGSSVAQPAQPLPEEDLSISTDPAQPPAPDATEGDAAFPVADAGTDAAPTVQSEDPALPMAEPIAEESFGQPGRAPAQGPVVSDLPRVTEEPEAAAEPVDQGPTIGQRAGDLGRFGTGVETSRLPSVGTAPVAEGDAEDTAARAIDRFAAPVEIEPGKPLMSVVLIDDGSSPIGIAALSAFPYPLTFAVDASLPDARAVMEGYRAQGFEVMALASMPEGSTARDTEVALETYLSAVPEAVALMETPGNGLQGTRDVSDQVAAILAASGHGLVLFPKGLNTAEAIAEKAGVPAHIVYRDLDARGEDALAIRRQLDQAAMKAGADTGVIATGRLRADTISALLLWGLQDRASRVALVPVSAVLTQDESR
ncbi:divergent polysaccharide deacetylase family protein [Mesobacterium pallidum]|uniref:divergent polysaccharide deacetylase family protein n=1 Tax=Mesobacterium pallidum TaxID=2872037 RepID=UPI001EE196D1|nr:divergent polysaccharide deacetylase family protein [Mesobacterium pallidum]